MLMGRMEVMEVIYLRGLLVPAGFPELVRFSLEVIILERSPGQSVVNMGKLEILRS